MVKNSEGIVDRPVILDQGKWYSEEEVNIMRDSYVKII